jgi:YD repeat-containing protein
VGSVGNHSFGYRYYYDNLNRLTSANAQMNGSSYFCYNTQYEYDRNGNITSLFRQENYGGVALSVDYNGNQMLRVTDLVEDDPDYYGNSYMIYGSNFDDYSTDPNAQYTYNANGAMTSDPYKGVQYSYDALGMPLKTDITAINGSVR